MIQWCGQFNLNQVSCRIFEQGGLRSLNQLPFFWVILLFLQRFWFWSTHLIRSWQEVISASWNIVPCKICGSFFFSYNSFAVLYLSILFIVSQQLKIQNSFKAKNDFLYSSSWICIEIFLLCSQLYPFAILWNEITVVKNRPRSQPDPKIGFWQKNTTGSWYYLDLNSSIFFLAKAD